MSNAGVPIRIIDEISGHRTLDELYKHLEVKPEQVRGAVVNLSMLTPVDEEVYWKKSRFLPIKETTNSKALFVGIESDRVYCLFTELWEL